MKLRIIQLQKKITKQKDVKLFVQLLLKRLMIKVCSIQIATACSYKIKLQAKVINVFLQVNHTHVLWLHKFRIFHHHSLHQTLHPFIHLLAPQEWHLTVTIAVTLMTTLWRAASWRQHDNISVYTRTRSKTAHTSHILGNKIWWIYYELL